MSAEDPLVTWIAPDFWNAEVETDRTGTARPRATLSPERWEEYRALFRETDVRNGISGGVGSVRFLYWATGMVTGGTSKEYVYMTTEPRWPVVESLDRMPFRPESNQPVFRHIDGPWYLVYMWDD
jgi:hypothetical protein